MNNDHPDARRPPNPPPDSLRPRILHVAGPMAYDDPAARACLDAALAVADTGGQCLVAAAGGALPGQQQRAGIGQAPLPPNGLMPWRRFGIRRRLAHLIREFDPHIIHAWGAEAVHWLQPMAASLRAPLLAGLYHTGDEGGSLAALARNRPSERCLLVTDSAFARNRLLTTLEVPPAAIATVRPAVDRSLFAPPRVTAARLMALANQWRVPGDRLVVLIPRLYPCGGHLDCLEAVGRLRRTDLHVVIADAGVPGLPERDRLDHWMARRGTDVLIHCGDETTDWPAAFMLATVVVIPARAPVAAQHALLEAQAMGRPVVAVDSGGVREVTLPGQTTWLVPPGDPAALAAALVATLDLGTAERSMITQRGQRFVATWFSRSAVGADLFAHYTRLVPDLHRPAAAPATRQDRLRSRIVVVHQSGLATITL